ncbi:MAG TPA: SMI1/KNR4 family protein [Vulgatibacter sp.]|nr:SMI1/KNR4 family protein [Vulgatibacter sp.]
MSEADGRAVAEAFLEHPEHELYDEATPGELQGLERLVGVTLPPSLRAFLLVGSGGVLATGALLLGTKDPEQLGATLQSVTTDLRREGLPAHLLPIVDGDRFYCLDLSRRDAEGECPVVEVDPERFAPIATLGTFAAFAREILLPS